MASRVNKAYRKIHPFDNYLIILYSSLSISMMKALFNPYRRSPLPKLMLKKKVTF